MTLYKKTLLIICIVVAIMLMFIYGASQIVLMGSFDKIDEQYALENVEIARDALNETINKIDSTTGDWAVWDDSYFFVNDPDENFTNSYLIADTNIDLNVNLLVFIKLSRELAGGIAFDFENQTEVPVPVYFSKLSDSDVLLQHHGVGGTSKGIILLPEGPMLLSSWPITNNRKLPVGGTIIMGRYLGESEIRRLSEITHLPLTIRRTDDAQMPSDFRLALSSLSKDNPILIRHLSDESIAGYTLLNDIYGNPVIILKVETPRAVNAQGKETVDYFIFFLVIIGIIFVVVSLFLLRNFVLSRLARLDAQVQGISRSGDNSSRISMEVKGILNGYGIFNRIENSLTLRNKTLLIMVFVFLMIIILLFTASQAIVMDRFNRLEENYTGQKVQFSLDTLSDDLDKLDATELDWASWNDTYVFINDRNEEYIQSNMRLEIFTNIRINLMLFLNSSGYVVYGKAFDLKNQTEVPVPRYFMEELLPDDYLLQHLDEESSKTGIMLIPEGPMLVASQPILHNDGTGPIEGTLIFGRFLNSGEIDRLSGITHVPISIIRYDDKKMPSDFQAALPFFSNNKTIHISPASTDSIAGYTLINDIYGKPGILLKVEVPGEISKQGNETLGYFMTSLFLICSVFSIAILVILDFLVMRRLNRFDSEVRYIEKSGNISSRVDMKGKDELSNLAGSLNNMLDALEKAQEKVSRSEAKNRAILDAIPDSILHIQQNGFILNCKAAKDKNPEVFSNECIGRNIRDILPQNIAEEIMEHMQQTLLTKESRIFQYQLKEEDKACYYEARIVDFKEEDVLVIITDITERKQAEKQIETSLKEKETLLKEIHHRVKNNMQIVSSLLNHQIHHIKDKNVIKIFAESQNRIASMALVHEKLYRSKNLAKIDFYEYINDLVANLFQSYAENFGKITLNAKIEKIQLDIDLAIPCGLIINELVTNSLKYAFPEGRKGEIRIAFRKTDEDLFELVVGDNGIGLPPDMDFKKTNSLGLHLVTILAENQLHGEINLNRNEGMEFQIKFRA